MEAFRELARRCRDKAASAQEMKNVIFTLCGETIRVLCMDFDPPDVLFRSVKDLIVPKKEAENVQETFLLFLESADSLRSFLPEELADTKGRFTWQGEEGRLSFSAEYGYCSVYDEENRITYVMICPEVHALDGFISHPFHMELGWWAQRREKFFVHSACAGMDGKGILISGAGGSGKSTLSMAALLEGMEFVADDYVLAESAPEPSTVRLYSTAYLMEDILFRLPELKKHVVWKCEERGKYLVSLEGFRGNVRDRLPLRAVLLPQIAHVVRPEIRRSNSASALIPLLSSTLVQNREYGSREIFRGLMSILRDLPVYDYQMTDDIRENARFLKEWVKTL